MIENLRELWVYRNLLHAITYRDIRIRYKQTIMGFMWAILMPVLIVLVGALVRFAYSLVSDTQVDLQSITGVALRSVPWAFTVSAIRFGASSLTGNSALVTKIYFPKEIFPISAVLSSLFDLIIASGPLLILVIVVAPEPTLSLLWVPALLLIQIMLIMGIVLFVSAASLYFRDVKYLVEIGLMFGIFVTPVFFEVGMFGEYGVYMMANPFSAVFEGLESAILYASGPDIAWLSYSFVCGAFLLVGGYSFFKRLETGFAESI